MKVPQIDALKDAVKRLEDRIAMVEDVTVVGVLDKFHTDMQNLVYEVQMKANRLGDGIAEAVKGQRIKVNESAPDYVSQLLAEPEVSSTEVKVEDKTPKAEEVKVKVDKKK